MLNTTDNKAYLAYLAFFSSFTAIEHKRSIDKAILKGLGTVFQFSLYEEPANELKIKDLDTSDVYSLKSTNYGFMLLTDKNRLLLDLKINNEREVTALSVETGEVFSVRKVDHSIRIMDQLTEELVPVQAFYADC